MSVTGVTLSRLITLHFKYQFVLRAFLFTNDVMTSYKWREADLRGEAGSAFLRRFHVNIMEFWFNKHVDRVIIRIKPSPP